MIRDDRESRDGERRGTVTRRTALRSVAGAATGGLVATTAGPVAAQSTDFGGWFDDVGNFDGVEDATGQDEVTVTVGAQGNGAALAFGPAAVRISPGTTVVWEWSGEGGQHNVVAEDGTFDSGEPVDSADETFEYTFDEEGTYKYVCSPHKTIGMKGAIVVSAGGGGGGGGEPDYGGWFSDVGNFDGSTVDATGQDEATVSVGAQGNGANLAFDPPAIHVDNGATVRWEWTGKGGQHNVVAEDGTFDSGEPVDSADETFEYTFEEDGIYKYVCSPHKTIGMKGAVVVGDEYPSTGGGGGGDGGGDGGTRPVSGKGLGIPLFAGTLFLMLLSPVAYGAVRNYRYPDGEPAGEPAAATEAREEEPDNPLGHDEFEPTGTLSLVLVYMAILVIMWVFMYFVEFLGNGPTVIG